MSLADALVRDIENQRKLLEEEATARDRAFEKPQDIVDRMSDVNQTLPSSISLDMFIAFREPFQGGWTLWLGDQELTKLPPALKASIPKATFEFKAQHLFRLSVWTKSANRRESVDIADIPDGAEIFVSRVTGLKLFQAQHSLVKMAQGNTTRVEVVTSVEDSDSDGNNTVRAEAAAGSEQDDNQKDSERDVDGNQTDHERNDSQNTDGNPSDQEHHPDSQGSNVSGTETAATKKATKVRVSKKQRLA